MTSPVEAQALAVTIETRVLALWKQEKWDRRWYGADWSPARHDRMTELRALVRLMRSARRLARRTVERQDPMTAALAEQDRSYPVGVSYHDYQAAGPVR